MLVGLFNHIRVHQPDVPDAHAYEVLQHRRHEAACPDDQNSGIPQPRLTGLAKAFNRDLAAVAFHANSSGCGHPRFGTFVQRDARHSRHDIRTGGQSSRHAFH